MRAGRESLEKGGQHAAVNFNLLEVVRKVAANVVVIKGDQRPEGMLGGHVHEKDGRNGTLRLTVALGRLVGGKGLQDVEEVRLPGAGLLREELMTGKLPVQVLGDVAPCLLGHLPAE